VAKTKVSLATKEIIMLQWIAKWVEGNAPTPEKRAEKAMTALRLELFHAEQRILDAQMQADYYRTRLAFCEEVLKSGIEQVFDRRREPQPGLQPLRTGLKLTAAQ
jgi:hypothetical protein